MKLLLITMSIRFTTTEGDVIVPKIWASRWNTLANLLVDFPEQDVIEVPYTYTDKNELEQWEVLNLAMDVDSIVQDASSVLNVVDFMHATSLDWSNCCNIDDKLPDFVREELYAHLGRRVREEGVKYPYQNKQIQSLRIEQEVEFSCLLKIALLPSPLLFLLRRMT